jgi:hypothetical protein
MKTIKDISIENINKIYSIIIDKSCTAGNIEWTDKKDFVIATFKIEDCKISDNYDIIEYGIQINCNLQVDHIWTYKTKGSSYTEYRPLYNQHKITKYLINEGFDI